MAVAPASWSAAVLRRLRSRTDSRVTINSAHFSALLSLIFTQFCEDFFSRSHGEHRGRTAGILISVSLCLRERFSFRSRLVTPSPSKKDFPTVRENLRTEKKDSRQGREGRQGRSNHNSVFFLACLAPFARAIWLRLRRAKMLGQTHGHPLAFTISHRRRPSSGNRYIPSRQERKRWWDPARSKERRGQGVLANPGWQ